MLLKDFFKIMAAAVLGVIIAILLAKIHEAVGADPRDYHLERDVYVAIFMPVATLMAAGALHWRPS